MKYLHVHIRGDDRCYYWGTEKGKRGLIPTILAAEAIPDDHLTHIEMRICMMYGQYVTLITHIDANDMSYLTPRMREVMRIGQ